MEEGQDFAGDMASWVNEENEESVRRALGWSSVQDVSNMGLAGCRLDWEDEEDNGEAVQFNLTLDSLVKTVEKVYVGAKGRHGSR